MNEPDAQPAQSLRAAWSSAQSLFAERRFAEAREVASDINQLALDAAKVSRQGLPGNEDLDVSVVIVSASPSALTTACLEAVRTEGDGLSIEVVLVGNGPTNLAQIAAEVLPNFVMVEIPINVGASVGRNLGVRVSRSDKIVFVDDDGIVEPGSIKAFLNLHNETGCAFARGKVVPLTQSAEAALEHYDLGSYRRRFFMTCEGIAFVDRETFLGVGGFDPLLFGHEGRELSARAWRFVGPLAFWYEPKAILRHDYASEPGKLEIKQARYERMNEYLDAFSPGAISLHRRYRWSFDADERAFHAILSSSKAPSRSDGAAISVITTAWNASEYVEEFVRSWRMQRYSNFEVVFVDDGSDDGTATLFERLTDGDNRFRLIRSPKVGRGAALNRAIEEAHHDLLAIADVDDLSTPERLSHVDAVMRDRSVELVSFITFNELRLSRQGGFPRSPSFEDFLVRSLFGMPGQFPTYAFRRSAFVCPFSTDLRGGVDCDWLRRTLEKRPDLGTKLIQLPVVYYRQSDGQISKHHNQPQKKSREKLIMAACARVWPNPTAREQEMIRILFIDRRFGHLEQQERVPKIGELVGWAEEFVRMNRIRGYYDDRNLCQAVSGALSETLEGVTRTYGGAFKPTLNSREKVARELRRIGAQGRRLISGLAARR